MRLPYMFINRVDEPTEHAHIMFAQHTGSFSPSDKSRPPVDSLFRHLLVVRIKHRTNGLMLRFLLIAFPIFRQQKVDDSLHVILGIMNFRMDASVTFFPHGVSDCRRYICFDFALLQ